MKGDIRWVKLYSRNGCVGVAKKISALDGVKSHSQKRCLVVVK